MVPDSEQWRFAEAKETSTRLLETLRDRPPFSYLRRATLRMRSTSEVEQELQAARDTLRERAAQVNPGWALPIVLEAIGRAYYDDNPHKQDWILAGPALKLAVCSIWPYIFRDTSRQRSLETLIDIVGAAKIVDQLEAIRWAVIAFRMDGHVLLNASGLHAEGPISEALEAVTRTFSARGKIFRLAKDTTSTITFKAFKVLPGIFKALDGECPSQIAELRDTWLSKIEQGDNPNFWKGLAGRLNLWGTLLLLMHGSDPTSGEPYDLTKACLFPESIIGLELGDVPKTRLFTAEDLFWKKTWFGIQSPGQYRNLIVDRPALRVSSSPPLFCTSSVLVGDSINSFVEGCVCRYRSARDAHLHPKSFQSLLSEPFEEEIRKLFEQVGFRVGRVTKNGLWQTGAGDKNLFLETRIRPPGEIDVLAVHRHGWIIVCECKVLVVPETDEGLRNLVSKLVEEDPEAIRSRLARKLSWIKTLADRLVNGTPRELAFIVLDRPWPGTGVSEDVAILEISALEAFLNELGLE
jgi:hypothetical protein